MRHQILVDTVSVVDTPASGLLSSIGRRTIKRLREIVLGQGTDWAELQAAVLMLLLGIWLLFCVHIAADDLDAVYQVLFQEIPGSFWGICFVVLGSLIMYGLLWEKRRVRIVTSMLAFAWWCHVLVLYIQHSPTGFAVPASLMLAISSGWCHVRLVGHSIEE